MNLNFIADDLETSAGIIHQAVRQGLAVVEPANVGIGRRPFGDRVAGQRETLVHIGQVDGEDLVECESGGIGDLHRDRVTGRGLVVEETAVQDLKIAADELKPSACVVGQAERMSVARVLIDHAL